MGREAYALMTGLFVVVLSTALVLIAYWLGQFGDEHDSYLVTTHNTVSGLKPESTVYFRGVEAGKVAAIGFDPEDTQTIRVRIEVVKGIPITTATFARLRVQPLTGLAQIELNNDVGDAKPLPTSAETPARIPLRLSLVDQLANSGQDLLSQADQIMSRLNDVLNDENRNHLGQVLSNLVTATGRLSELTAISADARRTLNHIDALTVDLKDATQRLRGFGTVSDSLTQTTLPRLNAALEELQTAAAQVRRLSSQLDSDPQSLLLGPPIARPGPGEPGYKEKQ